MTLFDRVSELAKKHGLSVFELSEKLNLSRNSIYSWKKSSPKAETLQVVADYFNVSIDYLLGRTNDPSAPSDDTNKSMAKQVMMRMNTNGLTEEDLEDIEKEMETFFKWRLEQIRQEREQGGK